jgi:GNAT superfamily N-acetyltransferase
MSSFKNYTTKWLADDTETKTRADVRAFCLRIIKAFYGIDYTPDWHADLDTLLEVGTKNWFSNERGGGFLFAQDEGGAIVAAGGVYGLINKPSTAGRLRERYGDATHVCQIVRVYLDPMVRRKGLGTSLVQRLETMARDFGYATSYLHADAQTPDTLSFWNSQGYRAFGRFSYPSPTGIDTSVDFEKSLNAF